MCLLTVGYDPSAHAMPPAHKSDATVAVITWTSSLKYPSGPQFHLLGQQVRDSTPYNFGGRYRLGYPWVSWIIGVGGTSGG